MSSLCVGTLAVRGAFRPMFRTTREVASRGHEQAQGPSGSSVAFGSGFKIKSGPYPARDGVITTIIHRIPASSCCGVGRH